MKKALVILLLGCILISAVGCTEQKDGYDPTEPAAKVFTVEGYDLQITADDRFYEDTGGSFDLQITNNKCYISIMAYRYTDLPEGTTPTDVYETQNEDLFSRRDYVNQIESTQTQNIAGGTVTYSLYSAEKDGVKNYYALHLVDLPETEVLAWVLISATPSYMEKNREYLHSIVCSIR